MRFSIVFLKIIFVTLILSGAVLADDVHDKAGTSAFPFLKINIGARAVAMGGAFTGLADDESALYYNPAGIAGYERTRFIAGYHNYFVDLQSGFLGIIRPLNEKLSLGGYVSYLSYGEFTRTDESGTILGEFGGGDLLAAFSIAARRGYNLSLGGTVKLIYESVDEYSASGIAVDLGARYSRYRDRLAFGVAVQNLGTQMSSLGNEKDRLPLTFRGGVAVRPRDLPITLAGDVIVPVDNDVVIAVGGEYWELRPFYVRLGWNSFGSNYRTSDSDDSWAGVGIGVGLEVRNLLFSYAFAPGAELGDSHRITVTGGL